MTTVKTQMETGRVHIIGVLVEDHPGVLSKLSGMISTRGFNIDTITVGKTMKKGISHIVISLTGDDRTVEQLKKQVNKLIDTIKIIDLNPKHSVLREHCLVKVASSVEVRNDLLNISKLHKVNVVDMNDQSMIIEVVGRPEKVDNFLRLMYKYDIKDVCRTGVNAMRRDTNNQQKKRSSTIL